MKLFFSILISCLILCGVSNFAEAQCALCKSSAESSLKEGNKQASGLNMGIMYLLVMPYLLAGGIGYYWYINNRKQKQQSEEDI